MTTKSQTQAVILISANIEWRVLLTLVNPVTVHSSAVGNWFETVLSTAAVRTPVVFFHGGWGKIAAAASAQYIITRWQPRLLLNLGTCGGFAGAIKKGTLVLAERTIVYDIIEQMTGQQEAIDHFSTTLDLSWLAEPYPQPVLRTLLVSGDRDLMIEDLPGLRRDYGAVAGDWESGAIAWVAAKNKTRCLILRGVTDLVGSSGGEAYDGNLHVFEEGVERIFRLVLPYLPQWVERGLAG